MAVKPMSPDELAQYVDELLRMRGNGLPAGRVQRLRECVERLRELSALRETVEAVERVVQDAGYGNGPDDSRTLVETVAQLAADADRPVAGPTGGAG